MTRTRSLVAAVVAAVALATAVAASGRTTAAFSAQAANTSTFSAAATFATPCDPYTLSWMTGMEHGLDTPAGGGVWSAGLSSGPGAVDAVVKRSGGKSLRLAPNAQVVYRGRAYAGFPVSAMVMSFAIRFDSLPAADVPELGGITTLASTTSYAAFRYVAATQRLAVGFPGEAIAASTPVVAGTWYTVDLRLDASGTTHTLDWALDGVAQPGSTRAGAATTIYAAGWGSGTAATYVVNYDDMVMSTVAADYPIGRGRILSLRPDGMGTSVGAANFRDDDGTAVDSLSWARLADLVMGDGTSTVRQTASSAASYLEMTLQDTTQDCVRAAHAVMSFDPLDVNQQNHGRTVVQSGATTSVVYDGPMRVNGSTVPTPKAAPLTPGGGTWSPAVLNDLTFRLGFSTDANPQPVWQSLVVEYDAG